MENILKQEKFQTKKINRGATILEMTFWLMIALGIIAAAISSGMYAMSRSDVNIETNNLSYLIIAGRELKSPSGYGAANTNLIPQMIARKSIPSDMPVSGNVITNAWNGNVSITSAGANFTVTYTLVPKDACTRLSEKVSSNGTVLSTRINSTTLNGRVLPANSTAACNVDNNTIIWTIR